MRTAPTRALPQAGLGGGLAGWREWFGFGRGAERGAGVMAVLVALVAALVAYVGTPFLHVSVDDRDKVLPAGVNAFRGLYLETRTYLTGHEVTSRSVSALDAQGAGLFLILAVPLLAVVGTVIAFRRSGRSLPLTIGMLVLAVLVLLLGFTVFLAAMIALAVASFQVRKVEMAARTAERAGGGAAREEPPQDAEPEPEDEFEDEDFEDEYDEDLDEEDFEDEYDEDFEDEDADESVDDDLEDESDLDVEAADDEDEDLEADEDVDSETDELEELDELEDEVDDVLDVAADEDEPVDGRSRPKRR